MKVYFKDYGELWRHSWQFMKNHWLGNIIFSVVIWIVEVAIFWPWLFVEAWNKFKKIFRRKKIREQ